MQGGQKLLLASLNKIKMPSLLKDGEGKVVGALCTQREDLASRSMTYVVYATRPRVEGQNAVPITLDDGSELSMFAWAKQTSTHNWRFEYKERIDANEIFLANATGFDTEASYKVKPHGIDGHAMYDTSVKARLTRLSVWTTKGELIGRGEVAVSEDKKDCWYEMDVAPNMDASLLVCAAIIRALIVDEGPYSIQGSQSAGAVIY